MKLSSIILLTILLALSLSQEDISIRAQPVAAGKPTVGGWQTVDPTNFENSEEERLVTEAVEHSRQVYEENQNLTGKGNLDQVIDIKRQIVAGFLYKITWTTTGESKIEIKVHQVPWQEDANLRYPPL